MSVKRQQYTKEFKEQILRELEGGLPLSQVAREHEVAPRLIQRWQDEYAEYGQEAFSGNGRRYKDQARIAELERAVGRQTLEVLYLQRLLRRYEQTDNTLPTSQKEPHPVPSPLYSESEAGGKP